MLPQSFTNKTTSLELTPFLTSGACNPRHFYVGILIGVEPAAASDGEIDKKVAQISAAFEGPFAIAAARGGRGDRARAVRPVRFISVS
jgi:hypothetical protein